MIQTIQFQMGHRKDRSQTIIVPAADAALAVAYSPT